jgi:DinB superfamily
MARIRWVDRRFDFSFPVELYPELIERLRGTPARAAERLSAVAPALLVRRNGSHWSVQEHAGHLADLDEELVLPRLDQYQRGEQTLRAADMTNQRTEAAQHNSVPLETVLNRLRASRGKVIRRLEELQPADFGRVAQHLRLNQPMRLVDLVYFHAEHDDYHFASISDILRASR